MKKLWLFSLLTFLLCAVCLTAVSATDKVVYLADGGSGDGASATAPVGTLTEAYNALGTDGGTIVICGTYTFGATAKMPAHTGTVTITNVYGDTDYRDGGANFYFSGTYTLRLQGATVFDGIKIVIATSKTPYVAANFNPLTFGYDVAIVNPSNKQSEPLRIYGGSKSDRTVEALPAGESSSLAFYSGYYTVHSFSYDVSTLIHKGTMHVTVGGTATVKDLWCGIYDSTTSYGGTIDLTAQENGKITTLYMAGNKTGMYLNGDATVQMCGNASIGTIKYYDKETLFPNHTRTLNIAGDAVTLPDGYADCFDVITKDGVQVKPAPEVTTLETVYVATGGTGDGSAADKPIGSLADAYEQLDLEKGGTIVLCGEYLVSASILVPEHTGTVKITSVYGGVDYRVTNSAAFRITGDWVFRFMGPTVLDGLTFVISASKTATIAANYHPLSIGTDVQMLNTNGAVTAQMRVTGGPYNAATVPVLAAGESSSLQILGGTYSSILAFSYSVANYVNAGTMDITLGGNAKTDALWFGVASSSTSYGGTVNATLKDNADIGILYLGGNNANMYLNGDATVNLQDAASVGEIKYYTWEDPDGKYVSTLNITGDNTSLPVGYGECFDVITKDGEPYEEPVINYDVVFVADGGTGDGTSADAPVATLSEAHALLNEDGGTVVVSGFLTAVKGTLPAHTDKVTYTSVYGGVDYRENGAMLHFPVAITLELGGETLWKDISLHIVDYSVIAANFHPVTFDTGVSITHDADEEGVLKSESTKGIYLVGGQNRVSHAGETIADNPTITLRSGYFRRVVGFGRYTGATTYTGTANILIEGVTIVNELYVGANADSATAMNANLTLKDTAEIWNLYMGGSSRDNFMNGTFDFQVYGGDIFEIDRCGLHTAVDCNSIFTYDVSTVPEGFPFLAELAWFKTIQTFCERNDTHEYSDPYASEFDESILLSRCSVCGDIQFVSDLPEAVEGNVVFVADGGLGDGSHPAIPTEDLEVAIEKLSETGGTIVFVGEYTIPVNTEQKPNFKESFFQEPYHKKALLLTSLYDGVDYRERGAKLVFDDCMSYKLAGPVTFDHIVFDAVADVTENTIAARYNPIIIGEDVKMLRDEKDDYKLTLLGGYRYFRYTDMADMVIEDKNLLIMTAARPATLVPDTVNGGYDYLCEDPAYIEKAGTTYTDFWLRSDATAAFNQMFKDMETLGMTPPSLGYAWRGYHQQYDGYTRKLADYRIDNNASYSAAHRATIKHCSMPGDSEHHLGLAFDFTQPGTTTSTNTQTAEWKWIMQNSWKYGIIHRYPSGKQDIHSFVTETWHWRYTGLEYATEFANMNASGNATANPEELMTLEWCFDEYVAMKYGMFDLDANVTVLGGTFAKVAGGSFGCDAYTFTGEANVTVGAGATVSSADETTLFLGDANGDGKVSLADVLRILRETANETPAVNAAADYNMDDEITLVDALLVLKALLNK